MKVTIKHELFKLKQQRTLLYSSLVLLVLMIYTAYPPVYITKAELAQGFGANQWVLVIMIAVSANFITMEFRDNTMPTLLYKSANKRIPYLAKFIVLFLTGIVLLLVGLILTLIFQLLLARRFPWAMMLNGHSLLANYFTGIGGTAVYLLFIISLSLLLVALFRSNATVIVIGMAIGFLGADLSAVLLQALPGTRTILAWNPLNMINIIHPFTNGIAGIYLSTGQLLAGNLIYTVLFLWLGLWAFKRMRI